MGCPPPPSDLRSSIHVVGARATDKSRAQCFRGADVDSMMGETPPKPPPQCVERIAPETNGGGRGGICLDFGSSANDPTRVCLPLCLWTQSEWGRGGRWRFTKIEHFRQRARSDNYMLPRLCQIHFPATKHSRAARARTRVDICILGGLSCNWCKRFCHTHTHTHSRRTIYADRPHRSRETIDAKAHSALCLSELRVEVV